MRTTLISWLLPIISVTVVIAVSIVLIYPWAKDCFNKRQEIDETEKELEEILKPKLEVLKTLDKEILRTQLTKVALLLPNNIQAPYIFINIENLAAKNQVMVEGLSFAALEKGSVSIKEENSPEIIQLKFIAKGEQDSLVNFVSALETAAPLFGIDTYTQSKNEEEKNQSSLVIASFYKTLPEEIGGIKEPLEVWTKKDMQTLTKIEEFTVPTVTANEESTILSVPLGKQNPF